MSISLKVGEIDPPSIIEDIVNLPNPVYLGITITAYNYDDVGLYFRITGSGTGYTFSTVDLGLIGSGGNLQKNLDNFCNRARPASETSEQIQLILRAYTDSGYTILKWTYTKTLDVWFIKSDDGSWTQDVLNNFDDGTVQGWAVANETGNYSGYPQIEVRTDYVLSVPNSIRMVQNTASSGIVLRGRLYKSFTTPNRNNVFAIADMRLGDNDPTWVTQRYVRVQRNTTVLVHAGDVLGTGIPRNRWVRFIVPLPKDTSVEVRLVHEVYGGAHPKQAYAWLDDFRIISRD